MLALGGVQRTRLHTFIELDACSRPHDMLGPRHSCTCGATCRWWPCGCLWRCWSRTWARCWRASCCGPQTPRTSSSSRWASQPHPPTLSRQTQPAFTHGTAFNHARTCGNADITGNSEATQLLVHHLSDAAAAAVSGREAALAVSLPTSCRLSLSLSLSQVRLIIEKLARRCGFDAVQGAVPPGDTRLLAHIRRERTRKEVRKVAATSQVPAPPLPPPSPHPPTLRHHCMASCLPVRDSRARAYPPWCFCPSAPGSGFCLSSMFERMGFDHSTKCIQSRRMVLTYSAQLTQANPCQAPQTGDHCVQYAAAQNT